MHLWLFGRWRTVLSARRAADAGDEDGAFNRVQASSLAPALSTLTSARRPEPAAAGPTTMTFTPAITLLGQPTALQWGLGFFEGKLLLPEPNDAPLTALPAQRWHAEAEVRHYLGQLDGLDQRS